MNNNTNIYDIDGEIIRKAGDSHKMTVQEASDKIEYYRKKLTELDEKDPKAVVYTTYMRNLSRYIMQLYASMTAEELNAEIEKAKAQKDLDKQVRDAIEELQKQLPGNEETVPNDGEVTNIFENSEVKMDEYVNYEEIEPVTVGGDKDGTND